MAYEHRTERPPRRGRIDDSGGDTEGGRSSTTTSPCWPRTTPATATSSSCPAWPSSRATTTSPGSTGSCSSDHHEGLIATTGCLGGHVLQALLQGDEAGAAARRPARLQDIFGRTTSSSSCRTTASPAQRDTNPQLLEIARKHRRAAARHQRQPLHPPRRPRAHDALLCVQTGALMSDPKRFKFEGDQHYLKTAARDALPVPRGARGVRQHAVDRRAGRRRDRVRQAAAARLPAARGLRRRRRATCDHLTFEGATQRWGDAAARRRCVERLAYELQVIADMGFCSYFLIVWDLIKHAQDRGIRVGPGRGARPAARWPTACASPTSTPSSTTCCSSASSTRAASRCPTSTWTSTPATGTR